MRLKTDYIILKADLKLATMGLMKKNAAFSELNQKMCAFVNGFDTFCEFILSLKSRYVIVIL